MNYRHAYHAGNFADVMKHVILVLILTHLRRKDTAFRVIDTHAGIGLYDLQADEAQRTGEWLDGVGRLDAPLLPEVEALIEPYRRVLADIRDRYGPQTYPGSPAITREMLRSQDRGIFVELHPADNAVLAERFNAVTNTKVLHLDGWTALHALIPPKEKRGLVLIDPPYEKPNELERLGDELIQALRKWPTGIYAAWYPIKDLVPVDKLARRLSSASPRPFLRLEILVDKPDDPARLNGSGMFVFNPPWTLRAEAERILSAISERLSRGEYAAFRCDPLGPDA